jgi:putative iron-only hydrogenase system regulator
MPLWYRDFLWIRGDRLETRVALIGIIVEDMEMVERINQILHEYGQYIIGRMGLPYREKNISIISIVVNAEGDIISTLAGKLGMIKGVSVKTIYSKK